ncbi:MAG TPA: Crp/Fnr family transcriptional regulator [Thermoanaerobaculia bacterium]|jgi:CRP-like cAMP-binding protein
MTSLPDHTPGNLLLRSLPREVRERAGLQEFDHDIRDVLIGAEETPAFVFFPHAQAVVSIVKTTAGGQMVEAGVVGNEGLLSVHTLLALARAPTGSEAVVQNEGRITRGDAAVVRELFHSHEPFRNAILAYTSVLLDQVTQNLLCNRLHSIEQRLAKWLLLMRDRVRKDELHLTQEFLSYMLGVHRPGVSIAMQALEADGLIRHRRNSVELRDPAGVIARSCECYRPLHEKLRTFVQAVP